MRVLVCSSMLAVGMMAGIYCGWAIFSFLHLYEPVVVTLSTENIKFKIKISLDDKQIVFFVSLPQRLFN